MPWPAVPVSTTGMDQDIDALPRADILDLAQKFNEVLLMRDTLNAKLVEDRILTAASANILFTGLDANTNNGYLLVADIYASEAVDLRLRFNNDTAASNYDYVRLQAVGGGTVSMGGNDNITCRLQDGSINPSFSTHLEMEITHASGRQSALFRSGSPFLGLYTGCVSRRVVADANLTQIELSVLNGVMMQPNSRVRIYNRK